MKQKSISTYHALQLEQLYKIQKSTLSTTWNE